MWLLLSLGCSPDRPGTQLPTDAVVYPVGVRTETWNDLVLEVWYPAADSDEAPDTVDFAAYIPEPVQDLLGGVTFPLIHTVAVRDAAIAESDDLWPVIVFSHGLGGSRSQSPSLITGLVSQGYVVVATDHVGRTLADLAPCLFTPPLEGCDFAASLADSGAVDLPKLADWAEAASADGWLAGALAPGKLGAAGHSLGGFSATATGLADERFLALFPMAGGDVVTREVPVMLVASTCDGIVDLDALAANASASADAQLLVLAGAGHLAYSDMCTLRFDELHENYLAGRTDLAEIFVDLLVALSADGCAFGAPSPAVCADTAYLDLGRSSEILDHYATVFFDAHLGDGPLPVDGVFAEATLQ